MPGPFRRSRHPPHTSTDGTPPTVTLAPMQFDRRVAIFGGLAAVLLYGIAKFSSIPADVFPSSLVRLPIIHNTNHLHRLRLIHQRNLRLIQLHKSCWIRKTCF